MQGLLVVILCGLLTAFAFQAEAKVREKVTAKAKPKAAKISKRKYFLSHQDFMKMSQKNQVEYVRQIYHIFRRAGYSAENHPWIPGRLPFLFWFLSAEESHAKLSDGQASPRRVPVQRVSTGGERQAVVPEAPPPVVATPAPPRQFDTSSIKELDAQLARLRVQEYRDHTDQQAEIQKAYELANRIAADIAADYDESKKTTQERQYFKQIKEVIKKLDKQTQELKVIATKVEATPEISAARQKHEKAKQDLLTHAREDADRWNYALKRDIPYDQVLPKADRQQAKANSQAAAAEFAELEKSRNQPDAHLPDQKVATAEEKAALERNVVLSNRKTVKAEYEQVLKDELEEDLQKPSVQQPGKDWAAEEQARVARVEAQVKETSEAGIKAAEEKRQAEAAIVANDDAIGGPGGVSAPNQKPITAAQKEQIEGVIDAKNRLAEVEEGKKAGIDVGSYRCMNAHWVLKDEKCAVSSDLREMMPKSFDGIDEKNVAALNCGKNNQVCNPMRVGFNPNIECNLGAAKTNEEHLKELNACASRAVQKNQTLVKCAKVGDQSASTTCLANFDNDKTPEQIAALARHYPKAWGELNGGFQVLCETKSYDFHKYTGAQQKAIREDNEKTCAAVAEPVAQLTAKVEAHLAPKPYVPPTAVVEEQKPATAEQ